ncbi:MAG: Hpt domain-containing protein, partial [Deferribacterales bacterium]
MTQIDMEKFRQGFLEEATDLLEGANESILRAESEGDAELFNAVFRSIHTIKGSAGGFGFDNMSEFSHHLETLLDKLRNNELTIDADITDLLLRGVDVLFEMVEFARDNKPYTRDLSELIGLYENMSGNSHGKEAKTETHAAKAPSASADGRVAQILRDNNPGFGKTYKISINFTDEMLENGYDPLTLLNNIKELSVFYLAETPTDNIPLMASYEPYKLYLRPSIYIISDASVEEINDLAFDEDLMTVEEISTDAPAQEQTTAQPQP